MCHGRRMTYRTLRARWPRAAGLLAPCKKQRFVHEHPEFDAKSLAEGWPDLRILDAGGHCRNHAILRLAVRREVPVSTDVGVPARLRRMVSLGRSDGGYSLAGAPLQPRTGEREALVFPSPGDLGAGVTGLLHGLCSAFDRSEIGHGRQHVRVRRRVQKTRRLPLSHDPAYLLEHRAGATRLALLRAELRAGIASVGVGHRTGAHPPGGAPDAIEPALPVQ